MRSCLKFYTKVSRLPCIVCYFHKTRISPRRENVNERWIFRPCFNLYVLRIKCEHKAGVRTWRHDYVLAYSSYKFPTLVRHGTRVVLVVCAFVTARAPSEPRNYTTNTTIVSTYKGKFLSQRFSLIYLTTYRVNPYPSSLFKTKAYLCFDLDEVNCTSISHPIHPLSALACVKLL